MYPPIPPSANSIIFLLAFHSYNRYIVIYFVFFLYQRFAAITGSLYMYIQNVYVIRKTYYMHTFIYYMYILYNIVVHIN